ncbi:hypothetical protein [Microbacterium sp. JZ31]|uniref:hypothetical protein n=1 Tax=Microbacterium sp. JZ31 TaxID=1906274 RepID=UPI0019323EA1|nr:hypothetical protein [Microbacterium sp. JZ31]
MNRVRLTYLVTTLVCIALMLVGFFAGVKPQLDAAVAARAEQMTIDAQNATLELRLADLARTRDELDVHEAELADLRRAIPAEGAYDAYLDEVYALARATGVAIDRVTFGDAVPNGAPADAPAAPTEDPAEASGSSAPATDTATPAPAETTARADAAPQSAPASGVLLAIPVQVGVTGPGPGVLDFTDRLQNGDRYTLVTRVSLNSDEDAGDVLGVEATALLDGFVWALPE